MLWCEQFDKNVAKNDYDATRIGTGESRGRWRRL